MKRKSVNYNIENRLVFEIEGYPIYAVVKGGDIVNRKTNRIVTKTLLNYTKGVWFGKKFITQNKLKPLLKRPEHFKCPF